MNKVSFEGIGETVATFYVNGTVKAGDVVKLSGDSEVKACQAGEKFMGVAVQDDKDGCVAVQVDGFVQVACADSTVTAGCMKLTANGTGGVKKAGEDDAGREYLVAADDGAGSITIKM